MASSSRQIRVYDSETDESNVIIELEEHGQRNLWKFTDGNTYYILNRADEAKYKSMGYNLVKTDIDKIPIKELNDYILATYANGQKWIIKKSDLKEEHLKNYEKIKLHNRKLGDKFNGYGMIYARTSTKDPRSINAQTGICLTYMAENGIKLVPFGIQADNGISARDMKNLDYELGFWTEKLSPYSHLVITNVDRLSRNLEKGMEFLKAMRASNITLHFVSEGLILTPDDDYGHIGHVYQLLKSAQQQSDTLSQKVKDHRYYHAKRRRIAEEEDVDDSQTYTPAKKLSRKSNPTIPIRNVSTTALEVDSTDDSSVSTTPSFGTRMTKLESSVDTIKTDMRSLIGMISKVSISRPTPELFSPNPKLDTEFKESGCKSSTKPDKFSMSQLRSQSIVTPQPSRIPVMSDYFIQHRDEGPVMAINTDVDTNGAEIFDEFVAVQQPTSRRDSKSLTSIYKRNAFKK